MAERASFVHLILTESFCLQVGLWGKYIRQRIGLECCSHHRCRAHCQRLGSHPSIASRSSRSFHNERQGRKLLDPAGTSGTLTLGCKNISRSSGHGTVKPDGMASSDRRVYMRFRRAG
ncbi:hypothetical protein B0H16DRAFT_1539332 [Mycena metata]|uniref:Uncharacterized protein n=1 Tax=Mycena metata TaxID=1033252 RepID=A0AAD7NCP1_9AGAR|nr:hypothetical protein B0H16DRAFT_1539332 [Mycena metata]